MNLITHGPDDPVMFGDLVRSPAGTVCYLESTPEERSTIERRIQAYASNCRGKVSISSINGFDRQNQPYYLIRVQIAKPGEPKKRPGRKESKTETKSGV